MLGSWIAILLLLLAPTYRVAAATNCVPITSRNLDDLEPYITIHQGDFVDLSWSPDSTKLAVSGNGGILLVSAQSQEINQAITFAVEQVGDNEYLPTAPSLAFSPDGALLAFSLWNLSGFDLLTAESRILLDYDEEEIGAVEEIAFNNDGKIAALITDDGSLLLLDVERGILTARVDPEVDYLSGQAVIFSSDDSVIIDAVWNTITFRDSLSLDEFSTSAPTDAVVRDIALTPNGRVLAGVSNNYGYGGQAYLTLWDMNTFEQLTTIETNSGSVSVSFNPNGDIMAIGGAEEIYLWEIPTSDISEIADHESHRLEGHIGEVQSVAFSPDGRFLASASVDLLLQSEDGNVIIWGVCS